MAVVRAALVTPLSGPLAAYGRAGAAALTLWAEGFAAPDRVVLDVVDAHPDARAAARRAEGLGPDLVFGPYGSRPAMDVAAATDRLVWNHGGASVPPRGNVVSVLAPADTYFTGAVEVAHREFPRVRAIGVLHGGTGFARAVAAGAAARAGLHGLGVHSAVLPAAPPRADALLVAARFEDELALARTVDRDRWRMLGFVAAGVREVLAELGDAREGLFGPAQWMPQAAPAPDEGPDATAFVAAYRASTGTEPPYPAAQAFAAGLVALRCLRESGTADDAVLAAAARRLECTTLFGRFQVDAAGRQIGHQVLTVQWQDGRRMVVWPPELANAAPR
ncbi:ABC transporter substrate-binding protein [Frankia sp. CNm7]|uniref:ABC transporter substrate-binding protein n=1 Tax=Frankia nepalensis TaxID=1836974 RepID=A0A937UVR4_9ACTN|nr:ABC transporter substrate-binding protein [Frankia nepalensis]MBL7495106.1 ABC transporter substrate-binding protein [Frankia nepalensis]MBL7515393.1 ABC transporter substrate-binding protein [Frankia nepalensis]MBL7518847.1 ABC transporter substrate-binding protein [Frankia nepalensis]MBL7632566.1 ABC transporter substrate-binding protein [Frankia nepalensis]